jgi:hypothetical protein
MRFIGALSTVFGGLFSIGFRVRMYAMIDRISSSLILLKFGYGMMGNIALPSLSTPVVIAR